MTRMLQWGVLSCADIGLRAVVPALQRSRNGRAAAISSRTPERARQAAAAHGIPRAYPAYQEVLHDPEIDAVYIPLPNALHLEWTLRAIAQGKHVLVEKMMALRPEEIDAIDRAATARGVRAMEALMYRLNPMTQRVEQILRAGQLGPVSLAASAFTYHVPNPQDIRLMDALGGGVLYDVGIYCISVSRMAFGAEPVEVNARARIGPASDVDEVLSALLTFPGGGQAVFTCTLHGPRDQWYRFTGADATLYLQWPFAPGTDTREIVIRRGWQRGKETEERIPVGGVDQYQEMVEQFGDSILEGKPLPIPLSETRANIAVAAAVRASFRSGNPIRLGGSA